jgi:mitochondrial fission protein ELM1
MRVFIAITHTWQYCSYIIQISIFVFFLEIRDNHMISGDNLMPTCWILTDGRKGTENNSLGLAEAMGSLTTIKQVRLKGISRWLAPWLTFRLAHDIVGIEQLAQAWPDIIISAGRTPGAVALYMKEQLRVPALFIHITNPGINPQRFDLVIAPTHDKLQGENVIAITGALHRITSAKLEQARALWAPRFGHLPQSLPRPWHGVIIGGNTADLTFTPENLHGLLDHLGQHGSTLATASRRTSPQVATLLSQQASYCWDGTGDNPYMGLLACCDDLYVSADSVSMLSEACSTGKPVYIVPMDGQSLKHSRFHTSLIDGGHAVWLGQSFTHPPVPLDNLAKVLPFLEAKLLARVS